MVQNWAEWHENLHNTGKWGLGQRIQNDSYSSKFLRGELVMFNLFKSEVKSVNPVKVAQSSDHLWNDLSANESESYSGGLECRYRRRDDTLVCKATGVP